MTLERLTKVTQIGISSDINLNAESAVFTGIITANSFVGDGSGLTAVTGTGSGVVVKDNDSAVGTAATINFSTNITVTPVSLGIVTVTAANDNTTYTLPVSDDGSGNAQLTLTGSDSSTDQVLLTAGTNVTFSSISAGGLTINSSGGGAGSLNNIVEDETPALGGELDVNNKSITGTGNVNLSGIVTATTFVGAVTGNADTATTATTATNVTVSDESSDNSCSVLFVTDATGNLAPKSGSNLTFDSGTGRLTATQFSGDGSALTNVTATGSGIELKDSGSVVGTAATVDFSTNLSVSAVSAGVATITASAGAIVGINTQGQSEFSTVSAGVVTATSFIRSGGTSSQFLKANGSVDSSTYLTAYTETDPVVGAINGIVKANGGGTISAATAGTDYLTPTGDGSSLTGISTNIAGTWILQSGDGSNYGISGPGLDGTENDPTLYLVRGQEYRFTNNTGGHPFRIQSTANGSVGTQYNDGITNNDAGNGTTLYWRVQYDTPDALYYQCTVGGHGGMGGKINIIGGGNWRMNSSSEVYTNENVGIGTDNPERTLSVAGNNPMIQIEGTGGNGKQWSIISSDDTTGAAAASRGGNFVIYDDTSGGLGDVLTLTGIGGSMGLGIQNPGAKLHVSGGNIKVDNGNGIDFSATSDASGKDNELLDDYEEGSWTPTNSNATITTSSGRYIKIGRLVTITARINWASTSNTSTAQIGGLPFAVDDDLSNSAMGGAVGETTYTGSDRPMAAVEVSDVIRFRTNGGTAMTNANWSSHSVRFSLTYFSGS